MREQLRAILATHKLTTAQAAELLGKHHITVKKWSAGIEPTPTWAVELLVYKLNDKLLKQNEQLRNEVRELLNDKEREQ